MDATTSYRLAKARMAELQAEAAGSRLAAAGARAQKLRRENCKPSLFERVLQLTSARLARRTSLFAPRSGASDCT